jgi:serine protease Do
MSVVTDLQEAAQAVGARVGPSVVAIGQAPRGSGVVIADGQVLTNAHNLRDRTTAVHFADDRVEQASAAGVDVDGDLAVLLVDTAGAPSLEWAPEGGVVAGSAIFAASRAARGLRVTFGLVSATEAAFRGPRGRRITGTLEHTAPLARGSSGGPVLDLEGRLVGINTNRLGEGFYLALPADAELRRRVDALAAGTSPARRRLGVGLAPAAVARRLRRSVGLPDRDGLLVRAVDEDGPAGRAGVRVGDLLVGADGRSLASADDLYDALDGVEDGATMALRLVRGAEELSLSVSFAEAGAPREEGSA